MVVLIAETVEALHICLGENQSLFLSCLSPNTCQNAVLGEVMIKNNVQPFIQQQKKYF